MLDTLATFHLLMSPLNVGREVLDGKNSWYMLVTPAVFHSAMLPYVVAAVLGLVIHAVAAEPMLLWVMAVRELTCAGWSISNAKVAKAFDAPKTVAPFVTEAPILVFCAAFALAFLAPSARAHGAESFARFVIGIASGTVTHIVRKSVTHAVAAAAMPHLQASMMPKVTIITWRKSA
jgi:hypothetical protein